MESLRWPVMHAAGIQPVISSFAYPRNFTDRARHYPKVSSPGVAAAADNLAGQGDRIWEAVSAPPPPWKGGGVRESGRGTGRGRADAEPPQNFQVRSPCVAGAAAWTLSAPAASLRRA